MGAGAAGVRFKEGAADPGRPCRWGAARFPAGDLGRSVGRALKEEGGSDSGAARSVAGGDARGESLGWASALAGPERAGGGRVGQAGERAGPRLGRLR
jgi:hypothetical protein